MLALSSLSVWARGLGKLNLWGKLFVEELEEMEEQLGAESVSLRMALWCAVEAVVWDRGNGSIPEHSS